MCACTSIGFIVCVCVCVYFNMSHCVCVWVYMCFKSYAIYKQNTSKKLTKGSILPFPNKNDFRIIKNYRGIALTAKVYNALLLNYIWPEVEKILRKKTGQLSKKSQNLTIHWINVGVGARNKKATLLFIDFSKAFDSRHREKSEANSTSIWSPQRNCCCYIDTL